MTDATYQPKIYKKAGGDELVVANGGKITVESGGDIEQDGVSLTNALSSASTLTLGTPAGTAQTITIQAKNGNGQNIAAVQRLEVYMCTDVAGATPSVSGPGGNVTASTGAILKAHTAKLHLEVLTDANGTAVLSFSNSGGGATYTNRLALVLPNGKVLVSNALAVPNA